MFCNALHYRITMGPKIITHTFLLFGNFVSQLHRTSVTQGFLAGVILCNSGVCIRYFLCACQLHTLSVGELIFRLCTHPLHKRKELFTNYLCNHFGPYSRHGVFCFGGYMTTPKSCSRVDFAGSFCIMLCKDAKVGRFGA